jgi:hypothetical protein
MVVERLMRRDEGDTTRCFLKPFPEGKCSHHEFYFKRTVVTKFCACLDEI